MPQSKETAKPKVGQRYRDDESGYLWDVIFVEPSGDAWCKHPNQKRPGSSTFTQRGWFDKWTLIRDVGEGDRRNLGQHEPALMAERLRDALDKFKEAK